MSDQKDDDRLDKAIAVFVAFATLIGVGWYSLRSKTDSVPFKHAEVRVDSPAGVAVVPAGVAAEGAASSALGLPVEASAPVLAVPVSTSREVKAPALAASAVAVPASAPVVAPVVVKAPEPAPVPAPVVVAPVVEAPPVASAVALPAPVVVEPPAVVEAPKAAEPKVVVREHIRFASDSAELPTSARTRLNEVAAMLKNDPRTLTIAGHTDSLGPAEPNQALSLARAEAVRAYLVEQGVAAERLKAVGMGEDHPVADNRKASGRAANRRIDITE